MKRLLDFLYFLTAGMILGAAVFVLLSAMTGCGTIAGVGQDLTNLANWTEDGLHNGFDRDDK